MRHLAWAFLLVPLALSVASTARADLVINEVMYRPHNESTVGRYELIELYNSSPFTVAIGGYYLTDSSDLTNICNGVAPNDNEGVFEVPAGTTVGPGAFLTFWHTAIPGVTDQPGNIVYNNFEFFGNLVLNNTGDQVTLVNCSGGPQVIDALDYGTIGLGQGPRNVSIERIGAECPTQDQASWQFTEVPPGGVAPGYNPGGTPGQVNSVAGSCALQLVDFPISSALLSAIQAADSQCESCAMYVQAWSFGWGAPTPPPIELAVAAVNGIQDIAYWQWFTSDPFTLAEMEAELAPQFEQFVPDIFDEVGNGTETVELWVMRVDYYAAPGASAWRSGYIVLFPESHRIAFITRLDVEI